MAKRLLVLPSIDSTHLEHWQRAPLPVLPCTMRKSLFLIKAHTTVQIGSLGEQFNPAGGKLQRAPDELASFFFNL
jgi:hypothetical protein